MKTGFLPEASLVAVVLVAALLSLLLFDSDTDFIDKYDVGQRDGTRLPIEFMVKI